MKRLLAVAVVTIVAASTASEACAQFGFNRGFLNVGAPNAGSMYGFAFPPQNLQDRMPHFALFPPTYYSYPVPRPYGYSPFAYPGFVPTPHVDAVEPLTQANPYVTYESAPAATRSAPTPAPQAPTKAPPMASPKGKLGRAEPSRKLNPFFGDPIVAGPSR
jgi:hypothetical protein